MKTPKPPKHLQAETATWFEQIISEYDLESHHIRLLILAAESWDRCGAARAVIDELGMTYADRFDQPKLRPEVGVERDCRLAFARLVREIGLDSDEPETSRIPRIGGR